MITNLDALRRCALVSGLSDEELTEFAGYLEPMLASHGELVLKQGEAGRDMYFVLGGAIALVRDDVLLSEITAGAHFGEIALLTDRRRAASAVARGGALLARLSREAYEAMTRRAPRLAGLVIRDVVAGLGEELVKVTDNVRSLLRERTLPRRAELHVTLADGLRVVRTGTLAGEVLSPRDGDALVVAALVDRKPVSLTTPLAADATVRPLSTRSWEGREVYRRSAGLLVLEAAHRVAPEVRVTMGPSLSASQIVDVQGAPDLGDLARRLTEEVQDLAARKVAFSEEMWTMEEATSHFRSRGWTDAALLLGVSRDATVRLVTAGAVYALSLAPLLPDAAALADVSLRASDGGLLLDFGRELTESLPIGQRGAGATADGGSLSRASEMLLAHKAWLATLGVRSVGDFNHACVVGNVTELIRAAEGFHEKRIGRIADLALARGEALRIVCIAGPSSSGKTTFIKRLTVQLQINGMVPRAVSLDDYYVDRERTPRDPDGGLDFEALEALDLPLLQRHLAALLAGESVKTARYDFKTGLSHPEGGPALRLNPGEVLLLEGIHGLNPALVGDAVRPEKLFRIFIHPAIDLAFDRLTQVSPADVRLLRRIVRDRHARGYGAAENIARWPSVRDGERRHIFPFLSRADTVFDSSLAYECSVLKVYADRYLLEVPRDHESYTTAFRLRRLLDRFVTIYPDHVPPTSILREFIGGSGFEY